MKHHRKKPMDKKTLLDNILVTSLILGVTTAGSFAFFKLTGSSGNIQTFYILAVVFIARFTTGYVPGIVASFLSVIFVNFIFTYPYFALSFSATGYPVTFVAMMIIASLTSMTTTHLKEKNRILNKQEKLLMEAEKEKMRANLLRAISHDLRTPLTGIIGASSTYLENSSSLSPEEKNRLVKTIYDDSNWLLHMVENLLSVTRIRQTDAHVSKSLEPLEEVVSEAVSRFKKRFPDARGPGDHPPGFYHGPHGPHPHRAGDHQPPGKRHLPQRFHRTPGADCLNREDGQAQFQVRDHGHGIREDLLPHIFDGYADTPTSSGDSRKGMGIGLSICKTIILAHDGNIWAENLPDGAMFTFTLPLGDEPYES